jgi:hypothetical protein
MSSKNDDDDDDDDESSDEESDDDDEEIEDEILEAFMRTFHTGNYDNTIDEALSSDRGHMISRIIGEKGIELDWIR